MLLDALSARVSMRSISICFGRWTGELCAGPAATSPPPAAATAAAGATAVLALVAAAAAPSELPCPCGSNRRPEEALLLVLLSEGEPKKLFGGCGVEKVLRGVGACAQQVFLQFRDAESLYNCFVN